MLEDVDRDESVHGFNQAHASFVPVGLNCCAVFSPGAGHERRLESDGLAGHAESSPVLCHRFADCDAGKSGNNWENPVIRSFLQSFVFAMLVHTTG